MKKLVVCAIVKGIFDVLDGDTVINLGRDNSVHKTKIVRSISVFNSESDFGYIYIYPRSKDMALHCISSRRYLQPRPHYISCIFESYFQSS